MLVFDVDIMMLMTKTLSDKPTSEQIIFCIMTITDMTSGGDLHFTLFILLLGPLTAKIILIP